MFGNAVIDRLTEISGLAPAPAREALPPVLFVSHGAPTVALEDSDYTRALRSFGAGLREIAAVAICSAHWETPDGVQVGTAERAPILHDFSGFPAALYALDYPSSGAPEPAARALDRLAGAGISARSNPRRGLDHGAWMPLRFLLPGAEVPVVPISLPRPRTPRGLVRIGRALAPLRAEGVLLVGSGGIVHNLAQLRWEDEAAPVDPWAATFDAWIAERLAAGDASALVDWETRAPHPRLAAPTTEHLDPLFFVLGAAMEGDEIATLCEEIRHGNLSMRSFALARPERR
jgi:4,5-DOPA dioxygenase extradiol